MNIDSIQNGVVIDHITAGSGMRLYEPPRKLKPGQRGGNRIPRSRRTEDLMSYQGVDRGFVLRFVNGGTGERTSRYGNRGRITPRGYFATSGQREMAAAVARLEMLIDEELNKIINT